MAHLACFSAAINNKLAKVSPSTIVRRMDVTRRELANVARGVSRHSRHSYHLPCSRRFASPVFAAVHQYATTRYSIIRDSPRLTRRRLRLDVRKKRKIEETRGRSGGNKRARMKTRTFTELLALIKESLRRYRVRYHF